MLTISLEGGWITMGSFFFPAIKHNEFGKEEVARNAWGPGVPPVAAATSEELAVAGCNEFGGHVVKEDECFWVSAHTCATPVPMLLSRAPGPSSTRLLPLALLILFVLCISMAPNFSIAISSRSSLAAAGGLGRGTNLALALLGL